MQAGEHATLQCSVAEGDLPLTVSWIFHGRELSSQMGIETTRLGKRTNILTIDAVAAAHTGNYTCVATNPVGSTNYTAELIVSGTWNSRKIRICFLPSANARYYVFLPFSSSNPHFCPLKVN